MFIKRKKTMSYNALTKILLIFALLAYSVLSQAIAPIYSRGSIAIKGYDTVAYFTEGAATKGNEAYSYDHLGATWQFESKENLDLFAKNPDKYMPQYGGYCAYAVSKKKTASIKPEIFKIIDDKLYLNYSESVQRRWLSDSKNYIKKADAQWPELVSK